MAAPCVVQPAADLNASAFHRRKTPNTLKTGWDSPRSSREVPHLVRHLQQFYAGAGGRHLHTAMLTQKEGPVTRLSTIQRSDIARTVHLAELVTELNTCLLGEPLPYGVVSPPPPYDAGDLPPAYPFHIELVHRNAVTDKDAPLTTDSESKRENKAASSKMDVDFGSTAGFQTRGKKAAKKAAKAAQQAKWFDDDEDEKKDGDGTEDGNNGGSGGDAGGGAGGAGGDDNGGGGEDDGDDWNFGGGNKKDKKKKKQEEEEKKKKREEEEKKKQEEEEDAAKKAADPLSWADDANAAADEDWLTGFSSKKDKKKKKKGGAEDASAPVADAPATNAFQDISLDDAVPNLEFSFEGGANKKKESGFGNWATSWDFGSVDKGANSKGKDEPKELADNNPWSLGGSKNKKKTTIGSGFDFGDFGTGNDMTFGGGDLEATKDTDDAWGFSTTKSKDKKKKGALVEEKKEVLPPEPEMPKDDDGWGGWGPAGKKKDKKSKKTGDEESVPAPAAETATGDDDWASFGIGKKDKKKKAGDPAVVAAAIVPEPESDALDWGFGTSKKDKKKKNLINDITEEPIPEPAKETEAIGEDNWMASAWGTSTKKKDKKTKKGGIEDLSTSLDLGSTADPVVTSEPAVDDIWGSFGKKDKDKDKKTKKGKLADPEPLLDPEPEPETVPPAEDWKPWDHGLTPKEKRRKEKELKAAGIDPESLNKPPSPPAEPEPEPEPEPDPDEDTWGTWGLSAKDKKKKEKEVKEDAKKKEIKRKGVASAEAEEPPAPPAATAKEARGDDLWNTWGMTTKEKKKVGKKGFDLDPEPVIEDPAEPEDSKEDDLWGGWGTSTKDKKKEKEKESKKKGLISPVEEVQPPPAKAGDDDIWGALTTTKDKKTKKKKGSEEPPPPVPTPPAQGLTPEPTFVDDLTFEDDPWASLDTGKKTKKSTKTEVVEEKKSSVWGFGTTSSSKTKKEKEKEAKAKKEAEEKRAKEAEEEAAREAEEEARLQKEIEEAEAAEAAAKAAKKKGTTSKSAKSSSSKLLDEKKKSDALFDLLDEPVTASKNDKLEKTKSKSSDKAVDDKKTALEDSFGFWGSAATSKKTTGKKDKEIATKGWTNQSDPLADLLDEAEPSQHDKADLLAAKSSKAVGAKTKVGSSIAERIKALEAKNDKTEDSSTSKKISKGEELTLTKAAAALETTPSPEEAKKAAKATKTSSKLGKTKKDNAPSSPPAEQDSKKSKDSVPGSFPDAFGDEEDLLAADLEPEKSKLKASKIDKKSAKVKTKPVATTGEKSKGSAMDDLLDLEPPKLPTPPPEEKLAKKERPRVERTGTSTATGWGFWGAAPPPKKKESSKTKEVVEDSSPPPPAKKDKKTYSTPAKSKSSKVSKGKGSEEGKETSKSSGSDAETKKKAEKPKVSRGLSFSSFMMGGAPPSAMRTKSSRRSSVTGASRSSSRRNSVDAGLASPPPEDNPGMSDKAAKLMGVKPGIARKASTKSKSSAYADPYPIDDDDMVMINTNDAKPPAVAGKTSKSSKGKTSSTKPRSKTLSGDEDVVMVDGPENNVLSGGDDPPSVLQPNSVRKSTGFFSNFFGGKQTVAEPKSDAEDALPIRTKGTSRRQSKVPEDADMTTDAPLETDADVEARRAERKAKKAAREKTEDHERAARETRRRERREREQADLEARRVKAKDRARKEREADDADREARRERRRLREVERDRQLQDEVTEMEAAAAKRREERRRLRAELESANPDGVVSKEDRRRSYLAVEDDKKRRKKVREEEESSSRRKPTALMDEYHESRSGKGKGTKPPANKTSSWIASQTDEPPEFPPVEGTVLDGSNEKPRSVEDLLNAATSNGTPRKKDKYAGMSEAEIEEARTRRRARRTEREKNSSGGSDERRRSRKDYDAYADPMKTFDGRPSLQRNESSKRNSFLGRFF